MLYLEDILEVIENVPQEIRDRTTELRELDLSIQNAQDLLEERIETFFANAKKMKPQERDATYEKLRKEYYRLLDDGDEKVNVANNMHDSLERYTRKLDQELEKFKYELEADSPGITEILEKRSLELDEPTKDSQKENRYHQQQQHIGTSRSSSSSSDWRSVPSSAIKKEELAMLDTHLSASLSSSPPSSSLSYTLGQIGAGSNAIAAAASQAIAATQQMQQGRRTASLKASYDAIAHGVHPTEFSIGSELANAAQTALAASALPQDHHHHHHQQQQQQQQQQQLHQQQQHTSTSSSNSVSAISTAGGTVPSATGHHHQHQSSSSSSSSSSHAVQAPAPSTNPLSVSASGIQKTSSTGAIPASKRQKKKHIVQQQQQQQQQLSSSNSNSRDGGSSTTSSTASATAADSNGSLPAAAAAGAGATLAAAAAAAAAAVTTTPEGSVADPSSLESPDWTFDPNEPRYCTCNQVSYGDMVACDNPRCPVEWFHYPCVGITSPPKGKWYCPQCSSSMNRRQRK